VGAAGPVVVVGARATHRGGLFKTSLRISDVVTPYAKSQMVEPSSANRKPDTSTGGTMWCTRAIELPESISKARTLLRIQNPEKKKKQINNHHNFEPARTA
jgi:hypothetical protein